MKYIKNIDKIIKDQNLEDIPLGRNLSNVQKQVANPNATTVAHLKFIRDDINSDIDWQKMNGQTEDQVKMGLRKIIDDVIKKFNPSVDEAYQQIIKEEEQALGKIGRRITKEHEGVDLVSEDATLKTIVKLEDTEEVKRMAKIIQEDPIAYSGVKESIFNLLEGNNRIKINTQTFRNLNILLKKEDMQRIKFLNQAQKDLKDPGKGMAKSTSDQLENIIKKSSQEKVRHFFASKFGGKVTSKKEKQLENFAINPESAAKTLEDIVNNANNNKLKFILMGVADALLTLLGWLIVVLAIFVGFWHIMKTIIWLYMKF